MNLSSLRGDLELYIKRNPIASYYAKWGALYAGILGVTILVIVHFVSSNVRVQTDVSAIRTRLQAMPEANLTVEQREGLMKSIQVNASLESKQFLTAGDIPTVLSTISAEAGTHAVALKKINTLAAEDIAGYEYIRIPIAMEVEGEYPRVGDFLINMKAKLPWNFTWERVRMTASTSRGPGAIQLELRLAFYSRKS